MLRELHIKNVAVIDEVSIEFENGFNVLTGETGAGKSILIDSINMALGMRTSKDIIRSGETAAVVDAVFDISDAVCGKLSEMGVDFEDNTVILNRRITADGKSRCRINGSIFPLAFVREAGELLLNIHGQNDNQALLSPKAHMGFVDEYGHLDSIKKEYAGVYTEVRSLEKRIEKISGDEEDKLRQIDLLKFQVNEIESSNLRHGEDEELQERKTFLNNVERIAEGTTSAYSNLYESEFGSSAFDKVAEAASELEELTEYDDKLKELYNALASALADMEDVTHELKSYIDGIDFEPGELDMIEERLSLISNLKRKYGNTIDEIIEYGESAREKLEQIEHSDEILSALEKEAAIKRAELKTAADKLSEKRLKSALELQNSIMNELKDLDMQKIRFSIKVAEITNSSGERVYTREGSDEVEFLISTNPGEDLKPLSKIASGGEMSRIMLAMKSVFAGDDMSEAMIFDEIDTGVSGRAAQKIAEKISALSHNRQILCITHLAQIASMADIHFLIEKTDDGEKTRTQVKRLNEEDRRRELARIIGGVRVTDLTLQNAEEMLTLAKNFKKGR